jgi:MYXO-CTERM domain-containing protein
MTTMPGRADDAASDEGCAAAGGAGAAGPGSLWWLAALGLALVRRRTRGG